MSKKTIWIIISLVILGIIFVAIFFGDSNPKPGSEVVNTETKKQLPTDFNLKDFDGNEVDLASFIGKPLVVNSWAVWCPFCVEELKEFAQVQREFGEEIVIIAIDRAESKSFVKRFTDELGVTDDLVFLLDSRDAFYKKIGGFSMPETVFVNSAGEIVIHKRGPMKIQEIKDKISQIQ